MYVGVDADCSSVEVEYSISGSWVKVSDNGSGIEWQDLQYIGVRYATSKCEESTFGCRGEALASLCQLGRVKIRSKTKYSFVTHEQNIEFGRSVAVAANKNPAGADIVDSGTHVSVSDLFANV